MSSPSTSPFSALRHYRELGPVFGRKNLLVALIARLPYAMLPLGIMTAFTASSGSLAIGGLASGVFSISVALFSPLVGRASDIWGQRRTLLILVPLNSLALLGLYLAAHFSLLGPPLLTLCVVAGATVVPVGSFTRARWVTSGANPRVLNAAFSYESMADEMLFVLGPALVGIAASLAAPAAPLLLAFIFMLIAGTAFALTSPRAVPHAAASSNSSTSRPSIAKVIWAVLPVMLTLVSIGFIFGTTQAGTTARAELFGSGSQAGLIYAVMGIGSALASLAVVMLPASFKLPIRLIVFATGAGLSMLLVTGASTITATVWALILTGLFIGPTMVTSFTLTERLAPKGGISVAMTLMQSSVTVGVSLGSALGGAVAQAHGAEPAYLMAAGATLVIILVGIVLTLIGTKKDGEQARVSKPLEAL